MVPSGQKWHRNREKTDIYIIIIIIIIIIISIGSIIAVAHQKSIKLICMYL